MAEKKARKPAKDGRKQYAVGVEEFVRAWQTSESAQEVADKLGMPKPIVLARASGYRDAGIKLKNFKRGPKNAVPVDEMNRLIEQIEAEKQGRTPEYQRLHKLPPEEAARQADPELVRLIVAKVLEAIDPRKTEAES